MAELEVYEELLLMMDHGPSKKLSAEIEKAIEFGVDKTRLPKSMQLFIDYLKSEQDRILYGDSSMQPTGFLNSLDVVGR